MTARLSRRLTAGALTVAALGAGTVSASAQTPDSDDVVVSATVPAEVTVTAPNDFSFGTVALGATATVPGKSVKVTANDQYTLSAKASGTLPIQLQVAGTPGADTAISAPFSAYQLLTASDAEIGARTGDITAPAPGGDTWTVDFRTEIPIWFRAGASSSTVTFTAVTAN